MNVDSLTLKDFRNYKEETIQFSPNINVIIGDNAQGKTNLLEAIYYLTMGKSFRSRYDKEIIRLNKDAASLFAHIYAAKREQKMEIHLYRGRRKEFFVNGVRLKTAAELSERLTAVLFCPDDLYMIREGAIARRKLMDVCISQLRPKYATILSEYNRFYEHKTRIIKDFHEKPSLLDTLDDFNLRLCQLGAELIFYRAHFSKKLNDTAKRIHKEFSGGLEELSISYKTVSTVKDPFSPPSEILPALIEHQRTHKKAEIESGLCLSGAHKDDLEILINGIPAKTFASQGQTRTAALSIKLAEREIHYDDRGEYPILLLDDVLSELDNGRQNFILNRINGGQIFISCCEDGQIVKKTGGKIIQVRKGEIV